MLGPYNPYCALWYLDVECGWEINLVEWFPKVLLCSSLLPLQHYHKIYIAASRECISIRRNIVCRLVVKNHKESPNYNNVRVTDMREVYLRMNEIVAIAIAIAIIIIIFIRFIKKEKLKIHSIKNTILFNCIFFFKMSEFICRLTQLMTIDRKQ
jgi:hypothetical protein